ncbi:MAG TPA: hypothetical protein VEG60_28700 [Candidatus Binatia bacterium]|nr:hypothetical protein [Candidatus Binatia bacterium]
MFHEENNSRKLNLGWRLLVPLWLCGLASVVSAQAVSDPNLRVSELAGGLSRPTAMAFIGPGDILVLQKADGRIRRVDQRRAAVR